MLYRATVMDTNDPEQRLRVRVCVDGVHRQEADPSVYPWADVAYMSGRGMTGVFYPYREGDRVFVDFEDADFQYPVVMGGASSTRDGMPDLPPAYIDDAEGRQRMLFVDRIGNTVELSHVAGEMRVRMSSGGASVAVSQRNNSIVLEASGPVSVRGQVVEVSASNATVEASTVNLTARGQNKGKAVVDSDADTYLLSDRRVVVGAQSPTIAGIPTGLPTQALTGILGAQTLQVGVGATPVLDHLTPLLPTLTVNIDSTVSVNINTLNANINATNKVAVSALNECTVSAPTVTVQAATATLQGTANVRIDASGTLKLLSLSKVTIAAPSISMQPSEA